MLRRTLFPLSMAAALAQGKTSGFKLAVRVEALFPNLTLPRQMEKVAQARYDGFEFGDWRAADPVEITKLKARLGLECVSIVGNRGVNPRGAGLCDPAERPAFLAEVRASLEAAQRFEASRVVILTGNKIPGMPRDAQRRSIVDGLKIAGGMAAPRGITLIVEIVNTLAAVEPLHPQENHLDYFLNHTAEAFDIMREVSSANVKILFDIYHVQIMDGNLIDTIRKNVDYIGHFHVGDVPGRHEPGSGEINYSNVFRAIHETGFQGYVAMEYVPARDALDTLAEVRAMVYNSRAPFRW